MYRFAGALPPRKVLLLLSYVLFFYKRTIFSQCSIHLFFHKIFTLLPMLTESIDPRTRDTKSDETQLLPSRNCNDGGTAVWAHFRRDLSTGTSSPTGVRRFPELRVQPAALRDEVMSLQDKEQAVYCNGRKPKLTAPQLCGCRLSTTPAGPTSRCSPGTRRQGNQHSGMLPRQHRGNGPRLWPRGPTSSSSIPERLIRTH